MEEFMKTEFFKNLPEDVKEKLKSCTGEEEVMDSLRANMIELPDDALDEVAGGKCYKCSSFFERERDPGNTGGDYREDVPSDNGPAKDFEEGRITGADFFK